MNANAISNTLSMPAAQTATSTISAKRLWTGRALSGLAVAFCLMDGIMKLAKPQFVVQATVQMGFQESAIVGIGLTLLACTVLYLIPRTAILGAVLLTGYLGGAVASGVRIGAPVFNDVFPILFAMIVWGGLRLRDRRLDGVFSSQR